MSAKRRREAPVIQRVREKCVERDGFCRLQELYLPTFGRCAGVSEWAHLGESKRFKTRGMAPERRHTTGGSLMLCTKHHQMYDGHELLILEVTAERADGPLEFVWKLS